MLDLFQPNAAIKGVLLIEGVPKEYEIIKFNFGVNKPVDYKGEVQGVVHNAQIFITIPEVGDRGIYAWAAKKQAQTRNGEVAFKNEFSTSPFKIRFTNAYCISMEESVNSAQKNGIYTNIVISAGNMFVNEVEISKFW